MSGYSAEAKTDIMKIIISVTENSLKNLKIKWKEKSMTIVLCSKGYQAAIEKIYP